MMKDAVEAPQFFGSVNFWQNQPELPCPQNVASL